MKKIFTFLVFLLFGFFVWAFSFAIEDRLLERVKEKGISSSEEFVKEKEEIKKIILQNQKELEKAIKDKKKSNEKKIKQLKKEFENQTKNKISSQKQKRAEKIFEKINLLNEKRVEHYFNLLNQLEFILLKIESRTIKANIQGATTELIENRVKNAHDLIEKEKEVLLNQLEKIYYFPEIESDKSLKTGFQTILQAFVNDWQAIERFFRQLKQEFRDIVSMLSEIPQIDEMEMYFSTSSVDQK